MTTKDGFAISYTQHSLTVTVTKAVRNGTSFDEALLGARTLLGFFGTGKTWGCENVGYTLQKKIGVVLVNIKPVGIKQYLAGLTAIRNRSSHA